MSRSTHPARSVISKISMIMLAMSEGSRTLTEIAGRSDLPLSTVHRLATDLAAWRVLERTPDGGYRAGPPMLALGWTSTGGIGSRSGAASIRDCAVPVMEDLLRAVGVRVRVGYLSDMLDVAYVQKDSLYQPATRECAAARLPAHATALGKALLAFSPPAVVESILALRLPRYTPCTLTDPQQLRAAFKTIRATRLAVSDRELEWDSCAVAAPVFGVGGQIVAAIELNARDLASDITAWRPILAVAAGSLSRDLVRDVTMRATTRPPAVSRGERALIVVDGPDEVGA